MTISILARDPATGVLGGIAATGSLCVGGWVLRAAADLGISASQGYAPSTLWGEQVLSALKDLSPQKAIDSVVSADTGKAWRQLAVLDQHGEGAVFSGESNTPDIASGVLENSVVAGNMLSSKSVCDAALASLQTSQQNPDLVGRLFASMDAAVAAGGDFRGLQSAALLLVSRSQAPVSLRIDHDASPIDKLKSLYQLATSPPYADWVQVVPTLAQPYKAPK